MTESGCLTRSVKSVKIAEIYGCTAGFMFYVGLVVVLSRVGGVGSLGS